MATRWGIAGVGKISHDFVTALGTLPKSEHEVAAVAARELSRAQKFSELHEVKKAYGSYEELAKDSKVEIVYIGVLHPWHLSVAKLMLEHGKHVLCEKPLTMNLKESTELINFAKKKGLFLMEAIWSRCFPIYEKVKKEIDSGAIGDVKQVIVSLGARLVDVSRLTVKAERGGTVLDMGVYTIQFAEFIFNGEKPLSIKATGCLNDDGVDESVSTTLLYSNNRTATIVNHMVVTLPNEAIVVGTKGMIRIPQFWCPVRAELPSGVVESPLPEGAHPFYFSNSAGLRYEAMEVRECLKAGLYSHFPFDAILSAIGRKESPKVRHAESLLIAEIQDEIRKQVGVVYPQDE